MERIVSTSVEAVYSDPTLMTIDNINALTRSHGSLNLCTMCIANVIAEEVLKGRKLIIKQLNQPEVEPAIILRKGIEVAKLAGAIPANAALLTATLAYFAGAEARTGCPASNRKLGAMARMIAGADKGGVILLPSRKSVNKISAYPAVDAIYHAMMRGELTRVVGSNLPRGVGGFFYGHGSLGEDYVFPELAENAARIGTEAMFKAYSGAGIKPDPLISALFATAATMEILHPDSEFEAEIDGVRRKTSTAEVTGRAAARAASLPEKVHFRITGEEFDTGKMIGDIGLMLKDVGTPTVIGMIAFSEIFACFQESSALGAGGSGGPRSGTLAHQGVADSVLALRILTQGGSREDAIVAITKNLDSYIDPVFGKFGCNTISRKAAQVNPGPVTEAIISATEKPVIGVLTRMAEKAYELLSSGQSLTDVVKKFENERVERIEKGSGKFFEQRMGKPVNIRIIKFEGGVRRKDDFYKKYYGHDFDADVEVTMDGESYLLEGFSSKIIPDAVINNKDDFRELIPVVSLPLHELGLSPHTIVNITIPVAVSCALNGTDPKETARIAEDAAFVTRAIQGAKSRARKVGEKAILLMDKN